jgi:hypothetical protein
MRNRYSSYNYNSLKIRKELIGYEETSLERKQSEDSWRRIIKIGKEATIQRDKLESLKQQILLKKKEKEMSKHASLG